MGRAHGFGVSSGSGWGAPTWTRLCVRLRFFCSLLRKRMAPRVPQGDSGFLLISSASAQRGHSHTTATHPTKVGHPASPSGAWGRINPPKSHTWGSLESFIELAEVGDEPQAARLCHGRHLRTGENRLDAQLLLCCI